MKYYLQLYGFFNKFKENKRLVLPCVAMALKNKYKVCTLFPGSGAMTIPLHGWIGGFGFMRLLLVVFESPVFCLFW